MKVLSGARVGVVLVAIFALHGCGNVRSQCSTFWECIRESFLSEQEEGQVLARVDNIRVTEAEMNDMQSMPPGVITIYTSPEGRKEYLNILINRKILAGLARKEGLDKTTRYAVQLRKYKENWLARAYQEELIKQRGPIVSSPKVIVMEITASHILVPSQELARKAQALLTTGGKTFAVVAKQMSTDQATAKNGGRLRVFYSQNPNPSRIEMIVKSLKDGQISEIIKTNQGFEIIHRDSTRYMDPNGVAEAQKRIADSDYINKQVEAQRSSIHVEIDEEALKAWAPVVHSTTTPPN